MQTVFTKSQLRKQIRIIVNLMEKLALARETRDLIEPVEVASRPGIILFLTKTGWIVERWSLRYDMAGESDYNTITKNIPKKDFPSMVKEFDLEPQKLRKLLTRIVQK